MSSVPLKKIGDYTLLEEIGRGGMGVVYKATDPAGKVAAIKVLNETYSTRPIERARFFREAELLKRLEHPNLVRAFNVGEEAGRLFFAMEYVQGITLAQYLKKNGRLSEDDGIRLAIAVAKGLDKAHSLGLVHRDIKPDNILITHDNKIKLLDLGLAKEAETDVELTQADRGLGTPIYMAPEQFRDAANADARADIYALAQTLYVAITGHVPFAESTTVNIFLKKNDNDFPPPRKFVPTLRQATVDAITQALDKNVKNRPQTVREFIYKLLERQQARLGPTEEARMPINEKISSDSTAVIQTRQPADQPSIPAAATWRRAEESESQISVADDYSANWKTGSVVAEEFKVKPGFWLDWQAIVVLVVILALLLAFVPVILRSLGSG